MLTSYYVKSSGQSYVDYLCENQLFRGSIETALYKSVQIPVANLRLLAGELAVKHYDIHLPDNDTNSVDKNPSDTMTTVSYSVFQGDADNLTILPAFDWKLVHLYAVFNMMQAKVSALLSTSPTPVETRAYMLYNQARDAFGHKDFALAKARLIAAIHGEGETAGYPSEWHFHHLLGIIQLGFMGCDPPLIDLNAAVHSFLTAAELAQQDNPKNAAISQLAAGWASYCLGATAEALQYTQKAIENSPKTSEAHFLKAKILASTGNFKSALISLGKAIDKDMFYAFKASTDGDFQPFNQILCDYLDALQKDKFVRYKSRIASDLNIMKEPNVPVELERIFVDFLSEKPLMDIGIAEQNWKLFKLKPWFYVLDLGEMQIEIETLTTVMEQYKEKIIVKPATWLRKEEVRIVTKNRIVEKPKVNRYKVNTLRDSITFFTGRIMADFQLVMVQGGTFTMGDISDIGRIDEKPIRKVKLSSYLIGCHQVTQKLWNLVMNNIPSSFTGYNLPVEQVSWYDCLEFCNKLSEIAGFTPYYQIDADNHDQNNTNKNDIFAWTVQCNPQATGYRLPTEAEWEYAARGGVNSSYYTFPGSDDVNKVAWYKNNSEFKTRNVGEKQSNELGIFDMAGNVWEWCSDWHDRYDPAALDNPTGAVTGSYRIIRGGSWADNQNYLRNASRGSENPGGKYSSIGLRFVRNIPIS